MGTFLWYRSDQELGKDYSNSYRYSRKNCGDVRSIDFCMGVLKYSDDWYPPTKFNRINFCWFLFISYLTFDRFFWTENRSHPCLCLKTCSASSSAHCDMSTSLTKSSPPALKGCLSCTRFGSPISAEIYRKTSATPRQTTLWPHLSYGNLRNTKVDKGWRCVDRRSMVTSRRWRSVKAQGACRHQSPAPRTGQGDGSLSSCTYSGTWKLELGKEI